MGIQREPDDLAMRSFWVTMAFIGFFIATVFIFVL